MFILVNLKVYQEQIKSFFLALAAARAWGCGAGEIRNCGKDAIQYQVSSSSTPVEDVIINPFEKFPLITQKWADYQLFKQAVELIKCKKHLTIEGLHKIVSIRATINKGLTEKLKSAFPSILPVPRPKVEGQEIKGWGPPRVPRPPTCCADPNWFAGFIDGEACFSVDIWKSKTHQIGFVVLVRFIISQHSRDYHLMNSLIKYLNCGILYVGAKGSIVQFKVTKFADITEKIIPFFDKYPLVGAKRKDFPARRPGMLN
jgi:hypothetical protein